jgi:hypothetical protein
LVSSFCSLYTYYAIHLVVYDKEYISHISVYSFFLHVRIIGAEMISKKLEYLLIIRGGDSTRFKKILEATKNALPDLANTNIINGIAAQVLCQQFSKGSLEYLAEYDEFYYDKPRYINRDVVLSAKELCTMRVRTILDNCALLGFIVPTSEVLIYLSYKEEYNGNKKPQHETSKKRASWRKDMSWVKYI